jgi:hypothetical protein
MPSVTDMLDAAKTTLARIGESASKALDYIDAWLISGGNDNPVGRFFRFFNAYRAAKPGATSDEATAQYYTAGYWANQGKYLAMLDPDVPVPRVLGRSITKSTEDYVPGQNYRYRVDTSITFSGSGDQKSFYTYVYSDIPLTQAGAFAQAQDKLLRDFKSRSIPKSDGGEGEDWWFTQRMGEYVNINVE